MLVGQLLNLTTSHFTDMLDTVQGRYVPLRYILVRFVPLRYELVHYFPTI
jgi:hypothetical protein